MQFNKILLILFTCTLSIAKSQTSFSNRTDLLPNVGFKTWMQKGVADMNNDGRDDIVRANSNGDFFIITQNADHSFTEKALGNVQSVTPLSVILADIDNYTDILTGGQYNGVRVVLNPYRSPAIIRLPQDSIFTQASAIFDINNDGLLDLFVCNDDSLNALWRNGGNGTFVRDNMGFHFSSVAPTKHSGNYGIVFTDFDNDGDTDAYLSKCRAGVEDPTDQRRINQLFLNSPSSLERDGVRLIDAAAQYGLADGRQSWVTEFQDIDNDGDMDAFIANHHEPSRLMENDGTGHYTDITNAAGLEDLADGIYQVLMRDFDNDGYVDFLYGGLMGAGYFKNNGNKTFTQISLPLLNPGTNESLRAFVIGDFNQDGFQDIYASTYWGGNYPDRLWLNNKNSNHYLSVRLIGTQSNRSSVGAKVNLRAGGKTQIREVRAGESYGISNSLTQYFGIGANTQIESLEVRWTSGQKMVLQNPSIDQLLTLTEPTIDCGGQAPKLCIPISHKIIK